MMLFLIEIRPAYIIIQTGNAKGWAYILFANSDVAQIAAEAMDGYLMYEKRLTCKI